MSSKSELEAVGRLLYHHVETLPQVWDQTVIGPSVLRSQKSQSQRVQGSAAGKDEGRTKRRRKNGGAEALPEVSRVEIEEVGLRDMSKMATQRNDI